MGYGASASGRTEFRNHLVPDHPPEPLCSIPSAQPFITLRALCLPVQQRGHQKTLSSSTPLKPARPAPPRKARKIVNQKQSTCVHLLPLADRCALLAVLQASLLAAIVKGMSKSRPPYDCCRTSETRRNTPWAAHSPAGHVPRVHPAAPPPLRLKARPNPRRAQCNLN